VLSLLYLVVVLLVPRPHLPPTTPHSTFDLTHSWEGNILRGPKWAAAALISRLFFLFSCFRFSFRESDLVMPRRRKCEGALARRRGFRPQIQSRKAVPTFTKIKPTSKAENARFLKKWEWWVLLVRCICLFD